MPPYQPTMQAEISYSGSKTELTQPSQTALTREETNHREALPSTDAMKMSSTLSNEQMRKLTPELIQKGLKMMEQLHLTPKELEALANKFSSLMPKDSREKGFDLALRAIDKLSAAQIKPILDFAKDISPGDARLLKRVGGHFMPSNPEKLIDKAAKMSPKQIAHKLRQVREGLHMYHQMPPELREMARSFV
jgi:hypothetical protein